VIIFEAAKPLQKRKIKLKGNIRFIFQNSEENLIGVKVMIKVSALENPNVDFVLGVHVSSWIKSRKIGYRKSF
jgi:metal-dependent amidase/aminoacylase/carboxypeptidase family protein